MFLPRISGQTRELKSPEQKLWRQVLFVAIRDALGFVYGATSGNDPPGLKRRLAIAAVNFFRGDKESLGLVCGAADLEPTRVESVVSQAIENRWGADPHSAIEAEPPEHLTRRHLANVVTKGANCHPLIKAIIRTEENGGS